MLKKVTDEQVVISSVITDIQKADRLILPGVGAFDQGMKKLQALNLIDILNEKVIVQKTPVLGICLGVQLFTGGSEEGSLPGLNWINGHTVRFNFEEEKKLKVPHIAWSDVISCKSSKLFQDMYPDSRFYFVHSYHLKCKNSEDVLLRSNYGYDFPAAIEKENILGVQFHPEKSHKYGMQLLKNFVEQY